MVRSSPAREVALALVIALAVGAAACKTGEKGTWSTGSDPGCTAKDESCVDETTARLCVGKGKSTFRCRGHEGCKTYDTGVACDQSNAREGESCKNTSKKRLLTCSEDERTRLACDKGEWVKDRECPARCFQKHVMRDGLKLPVDTVECE